MLHRYRSVMVTPGREKLSGQVEMDEAFYGGKNKPGPPGRAAAGKVLVAGAIERLPDGRRGSGRARLAIIPAATSKALGTFIADNISHGSTLITDGWKSYPGAVSGKAMEHEPINVKGSGQRAHELLPGVHRLFSLSKRWLEGTHQGAAAPDHLQAYLDEFVFRFNRRNARHRGLLFLRLLERAVGAGPITYAAIVANPRPAEREITPPGQRSWPKSLTTVPIGRPWRQAPETAEGSDLLHLHG